VWQFAHHAGVALASESVFVVERGELHRDQNGGAINEGEILRRQKLDFPKRFTLRGLTDHPCGKAFTIGIHDASPLAEWEGEAAIKAIAKKRRQFYRFNLYDSSADASS
jgi:hypothetical protein